MSRKLIPGGKTGARRRVRMRSALLLTLAACALATCARLLSPFAGAFGGALMQLVLTAAAFGGGAYLGLCVLDGRQEKIAPRRNLSRAQVYHLALLGLMAAAPATLLADIGRTILYGADAVNTAAIAGMQRPGASFLLRLISGALVAPVCEELFFRGYLLGALKRYGTPAAVLVSSLCFALVHGMDGMVIRALLGALFALLMIRSGSLYAPMLAHGCYNLALVLLSYTGLAPLFGRMTLLSCALRLALCAGFVMALKRFYMARPAVQADNKPCEGLTRRERTLLIGAAGAVALSMLLALITGVTG